jgi:hypothetical protein
LLNFSVTFCLLWDVFLLKHHFLPSTNFGLSLLFFLLFFECRLDDLGIFLSQVLITVSLLLYPFAVSCQVLQEMFLVLLVLRYI